jgi:hypothetical protein
MSHDKHKYFSEAVRYRPQAFIMKAYVRTWIAPAAMNYEFEEYGLYGDGKSKAGSKL